MVSVPPRRPTAHAFVDESGQRAFSASSSNYFLMSAVIVKDEDLPAATACLAQLRSDLGRRPGDPLSFKNLRSHEERLHAAQRIGRADELTISTVVVCKRRFDPKATGWAGDEATYGRTLELLLERLSWFSRDECWLTVTDPEGARGSIPGLMSYALAFIPRYPTASLRALEARLRDRSEQDIAWRHLDPGGGRIEQPSRVELLQLADLAVSATAKAFERDRFGNTERRYLEHLSPRLYRRPTGRLSSYGLKIYPALDGDDPLAWVNELPR